MAENNMRPLCFMMYLKSLNRNLKPMDNDESFPFRNDIDPNEIMFCQNSVGIFDNSYPGKLRDKTGLTGWSHVNKPQIDKIMRHLWWYREYAQKYDLSNITINLFETKGDLKARHIVMQVLHTINAFILKKMMAFGPELGYYRQLAHETAVFYVELLKDYVQPVTFNLSSGIVYEPQGLYTELKEFGNFVKMSFHKPLREDRIEWLKYNPKNRAFKFMFGSVLKRCLSLVESEWFDSKNDYSLSPAFMFRAITMSQNRGMGYLPDALAECKRVAFRATVNREPERLPTYRVNLLYSAMQNYLHSGGLEIKTLINPKQKAKDQAKAIKASVEVPLKGTASVDTYVKNGGKLEDARLLLLHAREYAWKIPIRNLETNEIESFLIVEQSYDDNEDPSRILFWISYQLFLNYWSDYDSSFKISWKYEFYMDGIKFQPKLMDAKILHISEPSKERNLTKSHACLAWLLTPAAKMLQTALAFIPEHAAGLMESSHDWRHLKRISSESEESWFLHDPKTGKPVPGYSHIFKDWTESTDYIGKHVGYIHCKALMDYVAFPQCYKQLVLKTIVEPQPVTEVVHFRNYESLEEENPIVWKGFIRDGFMMGNPLTKPILHSVHCTELEISRQFLEKREVFLKRPPLKRLYTQNPRLSREDTLLSNSLISNLNSWKRSPFK
jgi:hypothetical protein